MTNQDDDSTPTLDHVLSHLNKLRLNNTAIGFILTEKLLQMLRKVHQKCGVDSGATGDSEDEEAVSDDDDNVDLRKKYSDLFALAVEDIGSGSSQPQRETITSRAAEKNDDDEDDGGDDDNDDDDNDDPDGSSSSKTKSTRRQSG